MAYDEMQAQRVADILMEKGVDFFENKMFSGICFMVDNKMCCGTHIDKKSGESVLLCRLSEDEYLKALEMPHCIPMNFTGKAMKGYIYVEEEGIKTKKQLEGWIQKCLDFNPIAKSSKKNK